MKRVIIYLILYVFLIAIGSCRKDYDTQDPEIVFIKPITGYLVNLPDTIDVKVGISDDRIIRFVTLTLVNEDKIPVQLSEQYYPDSPEFQIETSIILEDKNLTSGTYFLQVIATDGTNSKHKYHEIILNEIPPEHRAYIAVTGQFSLESTIHKLNPAFETETQFIITEGHWITGVNSRWEKFLFISDEPSILTAYHVETFETEWEKVAEPPRPLITALFQDRDIILSTDNGDALVLSGNGNITLRTVSLENKTIRCLAADEKYIYAAHVSLSGNIHQLTIYYRVSGSIMEQKLLAHEIRGLVPVEGGVLVFGDSLNCTTIQKYDPENLTIAGLDFLQDVNLISTVKISENQIILLSETRVISYEPSMNHFNDFKDQSYTFCRYDKLSDVIFLGRDNMVYRFNRLTGALLGEISFAEEVFDFQILYNK